MINSSQKRTLSLLLALSGSYGLQAQTLGLLNYTDAASPAEDKPPAFRAGQFSFYPSISLFSFYESPISRQFSESDFITAIAPSLTIRYPEPLIPEVGLQFDYTPIYNRYWLNPDLSTLDHSANLSAVKSFPRLVTKLRHSFKQETDVYFEDGERTQELSFNTALDFLYPLSEKMTYTLSPSHSRRDYDRASLFGITTWEFANAIDYQATAKTVAGLNLTPGIRELHGVDSYTFERIVAKVSYTLSPKFNVGASAGVSLWQTEQGTGVHPIFNLVSTYELSPKTTFQASFGRVEDLSLIRTNQSHIKTQLAAQVNYQFTDKISSSLILNYRITEYIDNRSGAGDNAETSGINVGTRVNYSFNNKITAALFWNYRQDELIINNETFSRNRLGLAVTYAF